jgi:cellulose synthase/poly-beta-1,6-N-acetylglucosamine synthase-like glycosyltransferase
VSTFDLGSPETADIDAWIDDFTRPETTVLLYPFEADFAARVAEIEAQIPAAEKVTDRGMDDPTPETLYAQLAELKAEREAKSLRVRVRQVTDAETVRAAMAAKKAGVESKADHLMWGLSVATVHPDYTGSLSAEDVPPHFTGPQLVRLRDRDRTGVQMVSTLLAAVNTLMAGPPVPSSPER